MTQTSMAEVLGKPITTLNYHISNLRAIGLITKNNKLTEKGEKLLRHLKQWDKTFGKKLRAHKIQVTLFLSHLPPNFNELKGTLLTPFTNGRYKGLKVELVGCTVLFYSSKKAVAILPDIYGNSTDEIAAALNDCAAQLIRVLESEFCLKVARFMAAKFASMHVAILDSVIAETFLLKNKRCYTNGRIAIDNSHGRPELEAEDCKTALEDIEVLVKYEDLAREIKLVREQRDNLQSELQKVRKSKPLTLPAKTTLKGDVL